MNDSAIATRTISYRDPDTPLTGILHWNEAQAGARPGILLIHGGIYPVYLAMSSFADFLVAMGYPDAALRRDDSVVDSVYSYSPYQDSAQLAGMLAGHDQPGSPTEIAIV